ncbi:hypothetical protein [Nonlabens antarcticus]|uniref:hypothetical protein n=1 Tax=Nonlabens antarcticus TaxID=392714 RepID=UPI001891D4A6|nr:hypothetical protein [Nonlabens antarcticus]
MSTVYAQNGVGIGTTNPRKTLEVAGDVNISEAIEIVQIDNLSDENTSTFLIQDDSFKIKALDVSNPTGAALGYIQEYVIYNPNEDWVLDFDTGISSTDFVLNTISAYYDRELDISQYSSIPYYSAFIRNGTWHIIADFPTANNVDENELGTWTISTLIYSRDLSKQLGTVEVLMDGKNAGAAANAIIK